MQHGKAEYASRRDDGLRGQGDELPSRVYDKGTKVTFFDRDGVERELPNAAGQHLVRVPGRGLVYLNRVESRRKQRDRTASKKNYRYQHDKLGFNHEVNRIDHPPTRPAQVTNHIAHRERQLKRSNISALRHEGSDQEQPQAN